MTAPSLRRDQLALLHLVQAAYRDGARSVCAQAPTGFGKTFVVARGVIAPTAAKGRRVLFVADLEEILDDTAERLRALGLDVGVIKAGRASCPTAPVQVASLQTLARRLDALPPADRVILDECHIAAARTVRDVLGHYREALVMGLTATPSRGDGQPLDEFERLVCGPSMRELIAIGALVPPRVLAPDRVLDRGVCEDPVAAVLDRAHDRRCCIFAPDGASAADIAERLTAQRHTTVAVLDGMGREARRQVRARLDAGEVRSLVTVRALQKGFDAPVLDCAVLCTLGSIVGYLQSIGRALRSHPAMGKRDALVLDLRGAVWLHGLPEEDRVWTLDGSQGRTREAPAESLRRCSACHAVFPARKVCPRCGSVHVVDPRPMRVQRAEMFAASSMSATERARKYVEATERVMVQRGMPAHVASKRARERAPEWVKMALATVGQCTEERM